MANISCEDCMDLMARYPDKFFDLAVCDPPYGIGEEWKKRKTSRKTPYRFMETTYKNNETPALEYFEELKRVSKHQIIFGYNYFTEILGPTNYLIIWVKSVTNNKNFSYSQAEIAWTSIHKPIQIFHIPWDGVQMGKETGQRKIHPHQKPVELYIQILRKYSKPNWKILDTHMGSGSLVIAYQKLHMDVTASEIDRHYFNAAKKRIDFEASQQDLFSIKELRIETLFDDFDEAV